MPRRSSRRHKTYPPRRPRTRALARRDQEEEEEELDTEEEEAAVPLPEGGEEAGDGEVGILDVEEQQRQQQEQQPGTVAQGGWARSPEEVSRLVDLPLPVVVRWLRNVREGRREMNLAQLREWAGKWRSRQRRQGHEPGDVAITEAKI